MHVNDQAKNDFQKILTDIFDTKELSLQPTFIVEVGAENAEFIARTFEFVKNKTYRGKNLTAVPLEVVVLVRNKDAQDAIRRELISIPHRIAFIENYPEESILASLRAAGIADSLSILFLSSLQEAHPIENPFGWIQYTNLKGTDLLAYAKEGWFPKEGAFFFYKNDKTTLIHYEKRSYRIYHPTLDDVQELMRIEKSCWPSNILTPKQVIVDRITLHPNEQYTIKENDTLLGVLYTQRIKEIEILYHSQADTLQNLYDANGTIIQLISLFIDQKKQFLNLGDQLLEFALQLATLTPNITDVAGVTRWANYPGKQILSLQEYLTKKTEDGEILDPVPRMHSNHGALIKEIVPNFRPNDLQNDGCGIVIVYPLATREENKKKAAKEKKEIGTQELSADYIATFVDQAILTLLEHCGGLVQQDNRALYTRTTPLMDMGLDSLQLLELNSKLSDEFSITLDPTFFFQYGTAEAVTRYLVDKKLDLFKDWIYEIQWKPSTLLGLSKFIPDQVWIIFEENNSLAAMLHQKLQNQSQYCIAVRPGAGFKKIDNQLFEINPNTLKDFHKLLQEIPRLSQLAGVLYLWNLNAPSKEPTYETIEEALKTNCTSFINVANAFAFSEVPKNAKIWFINYGLITDGSDISLYQAPMSALCKVVRQEYPKSNCTNLVLDAQESIEANCEVISRELIEATIEPQVAWRKGKRFVPRMVKSKITKFRRPAFDEKAAYLVVGGHRALGIKIAKWYIERGAKEVILVDELEPTEEIKAEISFLEKSGASIKAACFALDDLSAWKSLIEKIPNLNGIIHAAGVIEQELLLHLTWDRFTHANRLKIASSWIIHQLTQEQELDHFVLFSTCLTDIAPTSRAAYLVGNVFLDTLSHYRRNKGLTAITIDWGPWAERQMLIQHMTDMTISNRMKLLNIDEGLLVLETILYSQVPQLCAAEIDWPQLFRQTITPNPFFEEIENHFKSVSEAKVAIEEEPIAIVGIGCRFPAGANTPEAFWRIFNDGIDVITEVPSDRWDIDAYYDPDKTTPGKMYTRYGGFIKNVDLFDPQFFGISPHEAEDMDPQQRISLEVAWEALENAGIAPASLKGTNTGVFMGICFNDYGQLITQSGDPDAVDDYYSTGNHFSVTAGRISYTLGLQGPAMAIDTACSSSLVAIDIACEKIRTGECDLALAGGVNLILAPESTINFCKSNMLAVDGRCKTFDAAANGYVRGEGCGIVVLKRLKDALRDNNPILAIVRATAVNQDGASTGLTVPNMQAQELLINQALRKANLEAKEIDYVEAHGTGTPLGDPIEVKGIVATYGQNRYKPLIIGSAKTNIGHTEAAAGVAGLIKCVLALQHSKIPKHLHFHKLNPFIALDENKIKVAKDSIIWPEGNKKRYAAVSSFGFSGTNSHIIVEEGPVQLVRPKESQPAEFLLALSAKSDKALRDLVHAYLDYLSHTENTIADITYTANLGRNHFEHRIAVSAKTKNELMLKLQNSEFTVAPEFESVANKYRNGETINWVEFYKNNPQKIIPLPNYPFQRQRCWSKSARPQVGKKIAGIHPLIGEAHSNPHEELFFLGQLHLSLLPYLKDHLVYKYLIYPAAAYLEMLLAASRFAFGNSSIQLKNVNVEAALRFTEGKAVDTQVVMSPVDGGYDVSIFSLAENNSWKSHVKAVVNQRKQSELPREVEIETIKSRCQTVLTTADFYRYTHSVGLCIGPAFHTLQNIYVSDSEGLGEVRLLNPEKDYIAHPALLDGCLQLLFVLAWKAGSESLYLPISFDKFELFAPFGDHVFAHWIQGEVTENGRVGNLTICTPSGKVVAIIEGVRFRKTNERALTQMIIHKAHVEDWLYEWSFQEKILSELPEQGPVGHWLILGDTKNASILCDEIAAKNGSYTLISLAQLPKSKEEYETLIQKEHIAGIIHTASTNYPTELTVKNLAEGQKLGAENVLYLFQALLALEDTVKVPTFILTDSNVIQSPIDGLFKTVRTEHPELPIKQIVVSGDLNPHLALQALLDKSAEPVYAIRETNCYLPRFAKLQDIGVDEKPNIRSDATYLITGGMGGLGIELAKKLAELGAGHIVLAGRKPCSDKVIEALAIGTKTSYVEIDISDEDSVKNLLNKLHGTEKPLKGIFHLAGVLQDATLEEQDWEHFEKVYRPKVYGTLYLHHYSKNLDHFVVYSSIASSMGNAGQTNYAAANAFMDALCRYRRQKGLAGLSIAWSFWTDVGMAKDLVARQSKNGMIGLAPHDATHALELLMASTQTEVTVANINWKNYLKQQIEPQLTYEMFYEKTETKESLIDKLEKVTAEDRTAFVKSFVRDILRGVLGLSQQDYIDEGKGFFEIGLDSLMGLELKNRLQAGIGKAATLATTDIFDHSSVERMTAHLCRLLKVDTLKVQKPEQHVVTLQADEPIAIIGMSCRFPGGANSLEAFWELLHQGRDAISEVPASRWDADAYYDPDPEAPGKMTTKFGGFLDVDVSQFDADFFRISPKEAEYLDPQQRLLLEVSHEALESAGLPIKSLDGSLTSVFLGICTRDYMDLLTATGDKGLINPYMATGNMFSTACGRVSYIFGLQGPNFPVDTACSSSLVAIDHACETLRTGEANLSLAGGVNLILAPDITIDFSKAGMLSEDGHCKTFDARADGYVRGEGCGIVVLKRLSDAKRDGDPIFAIIRASGVNQDGASSGLTVPNGEAQVALIKHVLDKAKLKGEDIDYVEAHGTGTRLGDPIEVRGIKTTYGVRDESNPVKLGSVKTNIGHLEGAAGVSGVIKTVLGLQHESIPKQLHFTKLNPHIELNFPAEIVTKEIRWERGSHIRRAAVSSFGFSGTNSHIIIEEAPKSDFADLEENREYILTLSAKTEPALEALIKSYTDFLSKTTSVFGNICYTSNVGRDHYRYRFALTAKTSKEAIEKLQKKEYIKGEVKQEIPYDFDLNRELQELAKAYVVGAVVKWEQVYGAARKQKVHLPSYPFQRQQYWADAAQATKGKRVTYEHPLLGEKHISPKGDIYYEGELDLSLLPYLKDHYVFTYLIYPGAAHLEMMVAACANGLSTVEVHLTNVSFEAPLEFFKGEVPKITVLMTHQERDYELGVFSSKLDGSWQSHAKSTYLLDSYPEEPFDDNAFKARCKKEFSAQTFYQRITHMGMNLGPQFQSLKKIFTGDNEAWAELRIETTAKKYFGHPCLVDGAIQLLSIRPWQDEGAGLYLPIGCDHVQVYAPLGDHVIVYCQGGEITDTSSTGNLTFCDAEGKILMNLIGMRYRKTTIQAIQQMLSHEYSVREFFYETKWQEVDLVEENSAMPKGHWLVLSGSKASEDIIKYLQTKGNTYTSISIQEHPQTKQQFSQLLEKENFCGIVHASSAIEPETVSAEYLKESQVRGAKSFLYLNQALVEMEKSKRIPVFLITQNCYSTNISTSPLSGLYKTVIGEHPELDVSNIDLGTTWNSSSLEKAILVKGKENIVQIQGSQCLVPRFTKIKEMESADRVELRTNASYLITGGCGDLGLAVCQWLTERGAKNIILVGRHPLDEERELRLKKIDSLDARVTYEPLDISNETAVRDFLNRFEKSELPLKGIFHLAGVLDDATLSEQDWTHFEKSFEAKVYGSFYLHTYARNLDLFVMFSSVASALGSSGQSNYAAANSFMDVLANYRKLKNLPALSISWGPWAEVGMAKSLLSQLAKKGLVGLKTKEALMCLEQALLSDKAHITIANINWKNYIKQFSHPPSMLELFIEKKEISDDLFSMLAKLEVNERPAQIKAYVESAVKTVLAASDTQPLDGNKNFFEMGFDSLMVVELKNRLQRGIQKGVTIEPTAIFDNPSIEKMAQHLMQILQFEQKPIEKKMITPIDLYQDAELRSDIVVGIKAPNDPPKNIFLTGVTGRLGAQLLYKLANQYKESKFYCLVRAKTPEEGQKRIVAALETSKIKYSSFVNRIQPVLGDLSLPLLGIEPSEYERLAYTLDVIFHCGALTNWSFSYEMMKPANIAGTEEIIKLAAKDVCKPIHHISTMAILPFFKDSLYDTITEDSDILHKAPLLLPYYQSKWVSEMQMHHARELGLKVNIYRPGSLVTDLEKCVPVTDEFSYRIADGCRQLGLAPDTQYSVSLTPLDVAAEVIATIASRDTTLNGNYHIVNPYRVLIRDLCAALTSAGYPITFLPVEKWIAKAKELEDKKDKNPLVPILDVFINLMGHEETKKENTNTMKVLAGASIHFPTPTREIIEAYCNGMLRELIKE